MAFDNLRKDFTIRECEIMIKILNSNGKRLINASTLAKNIGESRNSPTFNLVLKYLKQEGFVEEMGEVGNSKVIKINKKDLKNYIDEQEVINWFVENFYKKHHHFIW